MQADSDAACHDEHEQHEQNDEEYGHDVHAPQATGRCGMSTGGDFTTGYGFPGLSVRFNDRDLGWFATREEANAALAIAQREHDEWRRKHVRVELVLTRREADELRGARIEPRGVGFDSRHSVAWSLDSARVKLHDAIDRASRG